MLKLSVVICLYNEEQNIKPLIESLEKSLLKFDFEVIMVNDGSTDRTELEIRNNPRSWLRLINLRKNYGQSLALSAGIDHAQGEYIVTMDGDLQNDPCDIPKMLSMMESENWDMISGYRENRRDNLLLRKIPSLIANFIIRKTIKVKIKDYGCTLKIFRCDVAKNLHLYGELHRFIPVLASLEGATLIEQVQVTHHSRRYGNSKYKTGRTMKVISDLLLMLFFKKYRVRPMHLFGSTGIIFTFAGFLINIYLLILKLIGAEIGNRPMLIFGIVLFFSGLQLITIGIMTEMLMRIYFESQDKKPYNIKSVVNFQA